VNDVAGAFVAEDGMVLILSADREAAVAALFEADELFVAEVPAARPLVEVAADRALIANLRRADFARRFHDRRIETADLRVLGEIGHPHGGANPQTAFRCAH